MSREQEWKGRVAQLKEIIKNVPHARCSLLSDQLDSNLRQAVYKHRVRRIRRPGFFVVTAQNYTYIFKLMLQIEELYDHVEMRGFDRDEQTISLSSTKTRGYQSLIVGASRGQPSLITGDEIILISELEKKYYLCQVKDDDDDDDFSTYFDQPDLVRFIPVDESQQLDTRLKYQMKLVSCGACYDFCCDALREVDENWPRYEPILFPRVSASARKKPKIKLSRELDARPSKYNELQRQAIVNIVEATCRPHSYILFGPPGTGKTFTLLEALMQVYKRNRRYRILICASSNHVVDSIAASLAQMGLNAPHMHRFCSVYYYKQESQRKERIDGTPLPRYFTSDALMRGGRVVVSTNMNARRLQQLFDYIFIDEAGHSHEPETLIPITKLHPDGFLVLAGDPKQLGPLIKCVDIADLGLGKSLLERLCDLKLYKKNGKNSFNPQYITRLTESYRCDPRILNICNRLFYSGDLVCRNRTPPWLLNKLNITSPMQFVSVMGQQVFKAASSSPINDKEADVTLDFLFRLFRLGLSASQVGIITPYSGQKNLLINKCKQIIEKNAQHLRELARLNSQSRSEPPAPIVRDAADDDDEAQNVRDWAWQRQVALASRRGGASNVNEQAFIEVATKKRKEKSENRINWMPKIDTVDGFQGSECEIVLVSTVRTPNRTIKRIESKFLSDNKRFNVTLSRAKWLVVVFGHPQVLTCLNWNEYAKGADVQRRLLIR